ncbi:MAG: hypothetical protein KDB40_03365 [Acidimicrobiales bacterium]|nr:hypothetical protein [Acidimicrobiales bacterium]MCB9392597.1 hypothetical protein [Acidimicrobiaceae bacterium]
MLLTLAEVRYLASSVEQQRSCAVGVAPLDLLELLEVLDAPVNDEELVAAAGFASLVERSICRPEPSGGVVFTDLEFDACRAALCGADETIRVTLVAPGRVTFWLVVNGPRRRVVITPVEDGRFVVQLLRPDERVRDQIARLVVSAVCDQPDSGIAVVRSGPVQAMSLRTSADFGGVAGSDDARRRAAAALVAEVFDRGHPSVA